jgi:hypothetical protein
MSAAHLVVDDVSEGQAVDALARRAVESLPTDYSVRVPRSEEDRRNGFERWLTRYRATLAKRVEEDLRRQFPELARGIRSGELVEEAVERAWPEVDSYLRRFAIRGLAATWKSHRFEIGTTLSMPEPIGDRWRLAIGVPGRDDLAELVLDADGNVIESLCTSRQQFLERLRGGARP